MLGACSGSCSPAFNEHQPWVLSCCLQAKDVAAAASREEELHFCRGILAQHDSTAKPVEVQYARMLLEAMHMMPRRCLPACRRD